MSKSPTVSQPQLLPPITDPTVHAELDRLTVQYRNAGGLIMEAISTIGGSAETLMNRLPRFVHGRIDRIVERALQRGLDAAVSSRRVLRDRGDWFNRMSTTATGVAGGMGGLPGAMVELPLTVTLLLRAMLDIAAEHGLDPNSEEVRRECLRIFADSGPVSEADDGADLGLLAAKMSITGQSLQSLIAKVAPRLSAVLSQKLAAQAAPLLGAVAGATINYSFAQYYQQIARVHFGLMRLAQETGLPRDALVEQMRLRLQADSRKTWRA